mgnify:CR=1 FL=1
MVLDEDAVGERLVSRQFGDGNTEVTQRRDVGGVLPSRFHYVGRPTAEIARGRLFKGVGNPADDGVRHAWGARHGFSLALPPEAAAAPSRRPRP